MAKKVEKKNELAIYGISDEMVVDVSKQKLEAKKLAPMLRGAECNSPARYQWFSEQKANIRAMMKDLDEKRTAITRPMNAAKRQVDALFGALKDFEAALDVVDAKLLSYDREQMRAQQAALATAQEAASRGDVLAASAAIDALPVMIEGVGHTVRPTLTYVVTSMSEVRLDLITLDVDAMKEIIKAWEKSGSTELPVEPGITFTLDVKSRAKPV